MIAPPDKFRVATFGDSVMWSQGLDRSERFTALITADLAQSAGKIGVIMQNVSRSGAVIRMRGTREEQQTKRANFVLTSRAGITF
jgi:lysophospholipase L1-like esterase